jgi:putative ABC transport system permease protein
MTALDRKLYRDLWRMKGQALAVTLVVLSGVLSFIMFISTMDSLNLTRQKYYREYSFCDVFVVLKRAPDSVKKQLMEIPGVDRVETRVSAEVKLDMPFFPEPVTGRIISLPERGMPLLNKLYLRKGRLPDPGKEDEAVICDTFAKAHGLDIGGSFGAIINGRWKKLVITGVALSPEFVLQLSPWAISPDFKRYGILWMGNHALSRAYDMEDAFNDAIFTLSPGADANDVIARIDRILDRYGGRGAYARKDQLSHRIMTNEFRQLRTCSKIFPTIFIAVAAFLLNVVIGRIVNTQREQVATLKAFGYTNLQIGVHYSKLVAIIALAGTLLGILLGIWLGKLLGDIYMGIYRFPYLQYTLRPVVAAGAVGISLGSAIVGSLQAVWRAARQPPAESLRPEPPASYQVSLVEKTGLGPFLSQPAKMIVRNIERRPVRSLLSVFGIAIACSTMLASGFFRDAVQLIVKVQFVFTQKEDMTVAFTDLTSARAVHDIRGVCGVTYAEAYRLIPVRLRSGNRTYKTIIMGVEQRSHLRFILDRDLNPGPLPLGGITLTDYFAHVLGVKTGDRITVEVLEGSKPVRQVRVMGFASQYIGLMGFMDRSALNRMMGEGDAASGVFLTEDRKYRGVLYRSLNAMPRVQGTVVIRDEVKNFLETQAEPLLFFTFVAMVTACSMSFGVVYNSMRIALAERSRELSSLRVLGYTRGEISFILLGELGLIVLVAIPLGFLLGYGLCLFISGALGSDLFRVPLCLTTRTYALSAVVVIASAVISGLIVRRRLDCLDLVEVLKTKE